MSFDWVTNLGIVYFKRSGNEFESGQSFFYIIYHKVFDTYHQNFFQLNCIDCIDLSGHNCLIFNFMNTFNII